VRLSFKESRKEFDNATNFDRNRGTWDEKDGRPDFLYAAPPMFACAAFDEKSRMKVFDSTQPDRKSGEARPLLLEGTL
jgi:hypothetical protein